MKDVLQKLIVRRELTQQDIALIVDGIAGNTLSPGCVSAFLMGLTMKGATVNEIVYLVRSMRTTMLDIGSCDIPNVTDTCGTGGGLCTFNVSTANSIVAAAAGVPIAKHGSRSISSRSGSADVLESLGVKIDSEPADAGSLIVRHGYCFLYAPLFHPIMCRIFKPENELGIKTVFFTIIGPLINPAKVRRHVLGVFRRELLETVAEAATQLGYDHLMVVFGTDGLDEISVIGETQVVEVRGSSLKSYTLTPEELGLRRWQLEDIRGGTAAENAVLIQRVFSGEDRGARRDFILANTAATLYVGGRVQTLVEGIALAAQTIDSGEARSKLEDIIAGTRSLAGQS